MTQRNAEQTTDRGSIQQLFVGTYRYAHRYRATLFVLAIGLCFESLYDVAVRYALKFVIDLAVVQRDLAALLTVLVILGAGAVLFNLVVIGCDYFWAKTGGRIINDLRLDMFQHLQALTVGYHSRQSTGDLLARFNADVGHIDTGMVLGFPMAAMGIVEIVATLALMFLVHPVLCAIAAAGIVASLLFPYLVQRRAINASFALRRSEGRMLGNVLEKLTGQSTIKAFGLEDRVATDFSLRLDDVLARRVKSDFLSYLVTRLPSLVFLLLLLVVMASGGWLAINGEITVGELVAYVAMLVGLSMAIHNLSWTIPSLVEASASWRRIREVLDEPVGISDKPGARTLENVSGTIAFEDVRFQYPGSPSAALDGVSFRIPAGTYVAFVGPSGAGKSSIINIFMRFYEADEGRLLIEGQDVRDVTLQSLRATMGFVSQEIMLFDTSVRENIRMGALSASDDDIVAAAKAAEIHARIVSLPNSYDTPIGSDGTQFSGGERQRIALARALIRKPAILVLDEFSSALDPATETEILDTIGKLRGACTILSVTHRQSVANAADQIIVLRDGRILESGTREELIKQRGEYVRLWKNVEEEI